MPHTRKWALDWGGSDRTIWSIIGNDNWWTCDVKSVLKLPGDFLWLVNDVLGNKCGCCHSDIPSRQLDKFNTIIQVTWSDMKRIFINETNKSLSSLVPFQTLKVKNAISFRWNRKMIRESIIHLVALAGGVMIIVCIALFASCKLAEILLNKRWSILLFSALREEMMREISSTGKNCNLTQSCANGSQLHDHQIFYWPRRIIVNLMLLALDSPYIFTRTEPTTNFWPTEKFILDQALE